MKRLFALVMVPTILISCSDEFSGHKEGVTSGQLKIGVDNSYEPLMDTEIYTYTALNANAHIQASYMPESDVFSLLMKDSIQAAVVCRPLNQEEIAYFQSINRMPENIRFAVDAVALVINPANTDSVIDMDQLRNIFLGKITSWSHINPESTMGDIHVVFDNYKSSNARFLKERFLENGEFGSNCFAVQTNEEVINFVGSHKNAIGVISLNWISDNGDKTAQKFMEKVRVMGLTDSTNVTKPTHPRRPFQAYVYDHSYPLTRDVYYIRTGLRGSLGTGFANHLLGEKGQLIIDRIGMVPVTPPTRTIKITE